MIAIWLRTSNVPHEQRLPPSERGFDANAELAGTEQARQSLLLLTELHAPNACDAQPFFPADA